MMTNDRKIICNLIYITAHFRGHNNCGVVVAIQPMSDRLLLRKRQKQYRLYQKERQQQPWFESPLGVHRPSWSL